MTQEKTAHLILAGLCLILILMGFTTWRLILVGSRVDQAVEIAEEHQMQTITQNVTRLNGEVVTVTTERRSDESVQDWGDRHQEAVDYWSNH